MADIFVRGEGGGVFKLSLPLHETIEDRMRKGHIVQVLEDGSPLPHEDGEDLIPGLPGVRPTKNAPKAEWVGWAVAQGAEVEAAEAMTKTDLIDAYGADKAPDASPSDPNYTVDLNKPQD
jgi:hypothetical protein